jgi:hypothetical protein
VDEESASPRSAPFCDALAVNSWVTAHSEVGRLPESALPRTAVFTGTRPLDDIVGISSIGLARLAEVTDLVLYDVPGSPVALQQVLGRFDRFGRRTQLNVYALVPSNSGEDSVSGPLGLLRQTLGSPRPETHV